MVSVVLPFYNPGNKLFDALRSIERQTVDIARVILVNNNSNDGSVDKVADYAAQHNHVRVVHESRQGVAHAMNCGLQHVETEWVARLDADDIWLPNKLEKQLDYIKQHREIEVCGTAVSYASNLEKVDGFREYVSWSNSIITPAELYSNMFVESPIVNPSVMFKTKLINDFGQYRSDNIPEDYEMFLRWHGKGVTMGKVNEQLMVWNDSPNRLTRTHPGYTAEAFNQIKCEYLATWLSATHKKERGIWIWGAGRKTRRRADVLQEYGIEIEGYIDLKSSNTLEKPCIAFTDLHGIAQKYVVSFVSNRGKGKEIKAYLASIGRVEMEDFVLAG